MIAAFPGDPFRPHRRATREVRVGDVGIGGRNPIRVQSMTTTNTQDVEATAAQVSRLARAGCDIVRLTVPSLRDAEALRPIRVELTRLGVRVPLVADIHFTPNAAMLAAEQVEKVRVNPGNFADKKRFEVREYSDREYESEIERVAERFRPLVRRLKELGRALRIGTNHGSLSDRILNRYGDTPQGMVESALEFLAVCRDEAFHDVVFSMKASNPQVAVQAYRLLAARLAELDPDVPSYPFHVGVTEAGDGEDGRIKSAIGIGSLLEDGLGDTIRVSLTEDPVKEIPVGRALAQRYARRWQALRSSARSEPQASGVLRTQALSARLAPGAPFTDDAYAHARRATRAVAVGPLEIGGSHPVRVELALGPAPADPEAAADTLARSLDTHRELACEGLRVEAEDSAALARARRLAAALDVRRRALPLAVRVPVALAADPNAAAAEPAPHREARWILPIHAKSDADALQAAARSAVAAGVALEFEASGEDRELLTAVDRGVDAAAAADVTRLLFSAAGPRPTHAARLLVARLRARGRADVPVVLVHHPLPEPSSEADGPLLYAATDLGAPLCDGIGDAVALPAEAEPARALERAYRILQGARQRTTWTEFISCPSCGRTLFDLEETTARIKARTQHLSGVKIAVMGCIVNGPGEMADADFGYVGSGPGVVNLYVGKECVERRVPASEADDRLVELIRKHGRWEEPA